MKGHFKTGQKGEDLAADYLLKKGYQLLDRNWRHRRSEIDIIAKIDEILVFIEVKTRSSDYFGKPENFVSKRKKTLITDASRFYLEKINHEGELRFDIISILIQKEKINSIEHFKDAFFPGLESI